jgi:hypothetical protein
MKASLAICLYTLLAISASFGQVKSLPYGIYYFPSHVSVPSRPDDPTTWKAWKNKYVIGVASRESWAELEPTEGTFDFAKYLDPIANLAAKNGKQFELSVYEGVHGKYEFYPAWLKKSGAQFITFPSSGLTIPAPWDLTLQAKWQAVINAIAQRYDGNANLHVVQMQGPGRGSELYFAEDMTDYNYLNKTFGDSWPQTWQQAAETIAGFYTTAFVTTPAIYSNGRPLPTSIDKTNATYAAVIDNLDTTYNGGGTWRFGDRDSGYYYNAKPIPFYAEYGLTFQGYQQDKPVGTGAIKQCAQVAASPYYGKWFEVYDRDCEVQKNDGAFNQFNEATQP